MEDWWLARDQQGRVGWLLARRLDVDVPDEIAGYSEGQKMVGAYVLSTVYDAESNLPNKQVPIYLAVLNEYKDGLPYDFNQIRVFTWNSKKHRYETAYRLRNLEGVFPVEVTREKIGQGDPVPVFTIHLLRADAGSTANDQNGAAGQPPVDTMRFALEGNLVRKIYPAGNPSGTASSPGKPGSHRTSKRVTVRSHRY
jgi:hypothetical protein